LMDPYAINMMLGTFVTTYISPLQASMIVHMQGASFELYSVMYMMIGAPRWDGPRF